MTQVDSSAARHLGTPLDSRPTHGQGQAAEIDASTPLPDGWVSFCSRPDAVNHAHWYATAPWHADTIKANAGDGVRGTAMQLEQTVDADTWPALHAAVSAQMALYASLTDGVDL